VISSFVRSDDCVRIEAILLILGSLLLGVTIIILLLILREGRERRNLLLKIEKTTKAIAFTVNPIKSCKICKHLSVKYTHYDIVGREYLNFKKATCSIYGDLGLYSDGYFNKISSDDEDYRKGLREKAENCPDFTKELTLHALY
jgi:hypothetical protein